MFNIFKIRKFKEIGGAIEDVQDERDFKSEEIMGASMVTWIEKPKSEWRKFPIFHQDRSLSCVGQTVAKLLGIENFLEEGKFVHFSARDIYSRGYVSSGGMYYREGMKIGSTHGATVESLMLSQDKGEQFMRNARDRTVLTSQIALIGKGGAYVALPIDFNRIASLIKKTGKAVALGTRFNSGDWANGEVKNRRGGSYGHAVAVVDYTLWKGKKALIFDNSWGPVWGFKGQGIITQDQIDGVTAAWYFENLDNNWRDKKSGPEKTKPKFTFNKDLGLGMKNDDVIKLQDILKYEEMFPQVQESTGYYGGITSKGVYAFQNKYQVAGLEERNQLQGRRCGPQTRVKLNELYGN